MALGDSALRLEAERTAHGVAKTCDRVLYPGQQVLRMTLRDQRTGSELTTQFSQSVKSLSECR